MKKIFAYFLLVTYLFSYTEMGQFAKAPKLVEHYISHVLKDNTTTLFGFIKMHYLDAPVKDADYDQDMKLPFKTHENSTVAFAIQAPPKSFQYSFENIQFKEKKSIFSYSESNTIHKISLIFRPPIVG